jgi:hypothetical protein
MTEKKPPPRAWEHPGARILAKALREIEARGDPEMAHDEADALLVKTLRTLGYGEAMDVFEKMEKWYA